MHRFMLIVSIAVTLCGCRETPEEARARILADETLSDQKAIEQLAENIFAGLQSHSTSVDDNGDVTLEVVLQVSKDTEVKTIPGSLSAADVDSGVVLGMTVFQGRKMIRYGKQRELAELAISVLHPAKDAQGETILVDIFKYVVPKDKFERYLNTGSAADIAKGDAKRIIYETSVVEHDHFDELQYVDAE